MADHTDQKIAEALGWERLQRARPTDPQWWAKGSLRACIPPSLITDKTLQMDAEAYLVRAGWSIEIVSIKGKPSYRVRQDVLFVVPVDERGMALQAAMMKGLGV